MRAVLYVLLAVDLLQLGFAAVAFVRGLRSSRRGAPSHARYSYQHGLVLLVGAAVLAVPVILGLTGTIDETVAVVVALVFEVVAFAVSRPLVKRLEAAHLARRPAAIAA